jgi:hypothetical protein
MISVKDRQLLQEALDWRCDAFMTMERRLPTAAAFIERQTGLRVMRPTTYWGPAEPLRPAVLLTRSVPRGLTCECWPCRVSKYSRKPRGDVDPDLK